MLLTMAGASGLVAVSAIFLIREIDAEDARDGESKEFAPLRESPWTTLKEIAVTKTFWRYMLLTVLTVNVRGVFRHLDATFPKYMERTFGKGASSSALPYYFCNFCVFP